MRKLISIASAATFAVLASSGLCKSAPKTVRRGEVDLSSPYIPPAPKKISREEKLKAADRVVAAEAKRARKAARFNALVANGSMLAVSGEVR